MVEKLSTGLTMVALGTMVACASIGRADPPDRLQDLFPDTSVWVPILAYTSSWLNLPAESPEDSAITPWSIELPSTQAPWPDVETMLRHKLGARAPVASDAAYSTLQITPLTTRGDTIETQLRTGSRRSCPDGLPMKGNFGTQVLYVLRVDSPGGRVWSEARRGISAAGHSRCGWPPGSGR